MLSRREIFLACLRKEGGGGVVCANPSWSSIISLRICPTISCWLFTFVFPTYSDGHALATSPAYSSSVRNSMYLCASKFPCTISLIILPLKSTRLPLLYGTAEEEELL
ncbi:hypothetical protein P153DRAFT_111718 [Dothidotthia symphoricarpi CBS 119687]|uniref:Uncharacterized protein n=1 Tax=Dothidotthia symphoricarpi CBS 119687 TaxID=1392245 RepID=A0A6A6A3P0_9PLEO|nr:uncharacterized protein P153DRAFT_111718 [Dothidotthia symphoricarpi CBS 119687]KAF2125358.1 hypothetical protein P153DRAFT_111718 [Dothidotthia symphoricarpi CBS 119687]